MTDIAQLLSPPIISAITGVLGVLVGAGITSWTTTRIHKQRIETEQKITQQKIDADIKLSRQKYDFDITLSNHKQELEFSLLREKYKIDQSLLIWRRRFELAEQILISVYECRDALIWARGRGIFEGEGKTRKAIEDETPDIKNARDSAYVPIERLERHSTAFARLQTILDSVIAHFGVETAQHIKDIFAIRNGIVMASSMLIKNAEWGSDADARISLHVFRDDIWGERGDDSNLKLHAAVERLEERLRPILSAPFPS